jgi:pantoate--beta-alanine ligase
MRARAAAARRAGLRLGLVPTMGYFHEGHLSLMRRARAENDDVVVSLFVNPTQFGPGEDFERYPRDAAGDEAAATAVGVDVLFTPSAADMYPPGYATFVEVAALSDVLCGARRPGHFRGVATVVIKLFQLCGPDVAYFGRKDYQQAVVIKRVVTDLNVDVRLEVLPTVRDADGLALSSRNSYLTPEERPRATALFRALARAQALFAGGESRASALKAAMEDILAAAGARTDYVEVADPDTLAPRDAARRGDLVAVAAYVGRTRLIDNTILGGDELEPR